MSDVAYALSRFNVTINGRTIANLRGISDPDTMDAAPTRIMAGGKKAIGFNEYPDANALDFTFSVASPGGDEQFLDNLIETQADVTLVVTYTDVSDWPVGAFVGISGRGKISRAARQLGDEMGEHAYVVHVNGFSRRYKGAPDIVKP